VRILGFGTYDADRHPRIAVILEGLSRHGDDVPVANVPLGFSTADRVRMVSRPWLGYRLVLRLLRCWVVLVRRCVAVRRAGPVDAVVVGYLGHFDVLLARALFPRSVIVLDMLIFGADTAQDRRVASPVRLKLLRALDRLAMAAADLVMVDTEESASLAGARHRGKVIVVAVGASRKWFQAHRDRLQPAAPLSVVFYGLFTPLQGATVIGRALRNLNGSGIEVTMIGDGQDRPAAADAAGGNPNITWRDWVPADDLPDVVARHDVCLGIFGTGPKALRVVPNKVYQGAAAGCLIVTSDTPPQRRALGDAGVYVPAGDASALARVLVDLAADRARVDALRLATGERAEHSFAPEAVVQPLRAALRAHRAGPGR
jgi:glycosyltransferase involved in cell wall biosynthesis